MNGQPTQRYGRILHKDRSNVMYMVPTHINKIQARQDGYSEIQMERIEGLDRLLENMLLMH